MRMDMTMKYLIKHVVKSVDVNRDFIVFGRDHCGTAHSGIIISNIWTDMTMYVNAMQNSSGSTKRSADVWGNILYIIMLTNYAIIVTPPAVSVHSFSHTRKATSLIPRNRTPGQSPQRTTPIWQKGPQLSGSDEPRWCTAPCGVPLPPSYNEP